MARCPNCDRETVRTKDWVCLHCGYPLLSGPYRIIDNTYRELKDLIESGQITEEEIIRRPLKKAKPDAPPRQQSQTPIEHAPEPASRITTPEPAKQPNRSLFGRPKPQPAAEQKPELAAEPTAPEAPKQSRPSFLDKLKPQPASERGQEPPRKAETTSAPKPVAARPTQAPPPAQTPKDIPPSTQTKPAPNQPAANVTPAPGTPRPSPFARPQPATPSKQEIKTESKPAATQPMSAKPEPRQEIKQEPAQPQTIKPALTPESKAASIPPQAAKPEPAPEIKPATVTSPPVFEITVAELIATYENEGPAAEAKFAGKTMKLTGAIDRINVKDALNIYQITLNSPNKNVLLQGVRCVFDKSHSTELTRLTPGQTVTVQGKYDGSIIDITLRDCVLTG